MQIGSVVRLRRRRVAMFCLMALLLLTVVAVSPDGASANPPAPKVEQLDFKNNNAILVDHIADASGQRPVAIDGVGEKNKVEWQKSTTAGVTKNWPVVYVRKTKPKILARFALENATEEFIKHNLEGNATVTGEALLSGVALKFKTELTKAELEAHKGFFITKEVEAETELPNRVTLYEKAAITWKWKLKETGQPAFEQELGMTTHNIYLINATPVREPYLTLLDSATQGILALATTQPPSTEEIIKGVFREFTKREFRIRWYEIEPGTIKRGGKVMTYWFQVGTLRTLGNRAKELSEAEEGEESKEEKEDRKEEEEACAGKTPGQVEWLLRVLNGRCNTWAYTFAFDLAAEGITSNVLELGAEYGAGEECATYQSCFFLVKNWGFEGTGTSGNPTFPFTGAEVKDQTGLAGQGFSNPPAAFYNHFIVEAPRGSGALYDPSYGEGPYKGGNPLKELQEKSIAGFCVPGAATMCQKEPAALRLAKVISSEIL